MEVTEVEEIRVKRLVKALIALLCSGVISQFLFVFGFAFEVGQLSLNQTIL